MDTNLIIIIGICSICIIELLFVIEFAFCHTLYKNKRIADYFPTSLSTLGVLGTFYGIYVGLQDFDPHNIQASIPLLLDGLKTAFTTSLWGMSLSLGLSFLINLLTDIEVSKSASESDILAEKMSEAINKMSSQIVGASDRIRQLLQAEINNSREINKQIMESCNKQIAEKMAECDALVLQRVKECNVGLDQKLNAFGQSIIKSNTDSLSGVMESACMTFQSTMNDILGQLIKENFDELNNSVQTLNKWQISNMSLMKELTDSCSSVINQLDSSVQNMANNLESNSNKAIEGIASQCDLVTSRLEDSGIEMSVVLRQTIDQIVSSLSIFSKSMTDDFTVKYRQMLDEISHSTQIMEKLVEYTYTLGGAEGELGNLVTELKKVMISDKSFVKITQNLSESITKNAETINHINDVSKMLSSWMKNSTEMTEQLNLLILKLDELNNMKDLNSEFWSSAKVQFEDGIKVLKSGSEELNKQLKNIDQHFNDRLSLIKATLEEYIMKLKKQRQSN